MAQCDLLGSISNSVLDALINLVLGEGSTVELDDLAVYGYPGSLADQTGHLSRIVVLNCDRASGTWENLLNEICRERIHISYLQEIRLDSISPEILHPVQDRALRRSPADQGNRCRRRPV